MPLEVTLLNGSRHKLLDDDLLIRLDDLYAYYHKQWWCRRQMFYRYKWSHGLLNGLALLLMAASVVVGAVRENSLIAVGLTALGTVVKGWNDFKKFSFKVDMCRFSYTTYEKTLIELKTYVRGLPLEEFDGFLVKMQTLDDTITDFTPPCPTSTRASTPNTINTLPWSLPLKRINGPSLRCDLPFHDAQEKEKTKGRFLLEKIRFTHGTSQVSGRCQKKTKRERFIPSGSHPRCHRSRKNRQSPKTKTKISRWKRMR